MINKNAFKAKVEKQGNIVAIRVAGNSSCLWLNMYLDCDNGQMTCDSDVGSYAYSWGGGYGVKRNFLRFCCKWLGDKHWLLRKCVDERNGRLAFEYEATIKSLRQDYEYYCDGEEPSMEDFERAIEEAQGYNDDSVAWTLAFHFAAYSLGVDLPEEWYECIRCDYTPCQKRFAEICREVIVPELRKWVDGGTDTNVPTNGGVEA